MHTTASTAIANGETHITHTRDSRPIYNYNYLAPSQPFVHAHPNKVVHHNVRWRYRGLALTTQGRSLRLPLASLLPRLSLPRVPVSIAAASRGGPW